MRVLHYLFGLPPVRNGGLTKYALDLMKGQKEQGIDVLLMIPGEIHKNRKIEIRKKKYHGFVCFHVINPILVTCGKKIDDLTLLCDKGDVKVYEDFLNKNSPDIIHIHSLMGLHLAFLQAAKQLNIPTVFTTHDYYGLCPKGDYYRKGRGECENDRSLCELCMGNPVKILGLRRQHMQYYMYLKSNFFVKWLEYSKILLRLKWWLRKKGEKQILTDIKKTKNTANNFDILDMYYKNMFSLITFFHFNSIQAEKQYNTSLKNIQGRVINISNHNVSDNRRIHEYGKTLRLAYLSGRQEIKGYKVLLEILDRLYCNGFHDFECHIYCNEDRFGVPYLKAHKPYTERKIKQVFKNADVLIVPSLWKETFGMVVLEAISYGVPVIISKNVGAKDILDRNKGVGIIVDVENDKDALYNVIKKTYENRQILVQMNKNIVKAKINLSYDEHVKEIIKLYRSLKE